MDVVTVRSKIHPDWTFRVPVPFRGMFDFPIATDVGAKLVELFTLADEALSELHSDDALTLHEKLILGVSLVSEVIDRAISWYVFAISRNN